MVSTPASIKASVLSIKSPLTPTAAPTSGRPFLSFDAFGYFSKSEISWLVIRPFTQLLSSTRGSFSILLFFRISLAFCRSIPGFAVTTSFVINSLTNLEQSDGSNNTSRSVKIPTSLELESVTKSPDISLSFIKLKAFCIVCSGLTEYGFSMIILPERLTFRTSFTSSCIVRNLCMIPIPPSRDIATAIEASVTVSILALINGIFKEMFLESCVERSV